MLSLCLLQGLRLCELFKKKFKLTNMKKYTFFHFFRVYSLVLSLILIPILYVQIPKVSVDLAVCMVVVWLMVIALFVISHLAIKHK